MTDTPYRRVCFCGPPLLPGDAIPVRLISAGDIVTPDGASPSTAIFVQGTFFPSGTPAGTIASPYFQKQLAFGSVLCGTTRDAGKTEAAPTGDLDGAELPALSSKETIALYADIPAAGAATISGIIWLFCAFATVGSKWFPTRQITLGNAAAVAADTTGALGAVAEISWPDGASRVAWQGLDDSGSPTHRYVTFVAE